MTFLKWLWSNRCVIRIATHEDAHRIAEIHVASWRAAYRELLPQESIEWITVESRESLWSDLCRREDGPVFIEEAEDGCVAGFCHVCCGRDADLANTAEITCIYVQPGQERHGVGRQLMLAAEEFARSNGYSGTCLWVLMENLPGRQFYEALGFRPDGKVKEEPFAGCTLHEMRYQHALCA